MKRDAHDFNHYKEAVIGAAVDIASIDDRVVGVEDLNGQQLGGYTKYIMPEEAEAVAERWKSFGWSTEIVDGHDIEALKEAIDRAKSVEGMPHMIVMKTQTSHGYIPGEGIKANHSMPIKKEDAEAAIKALKEREGR